MSLGSCFFLLFFLFLFGWSGGLVRVGFKWFLCHSDFLVLLLLLRSFEILRPNVLAGFFVEIWCCCPYLMYSASQMNLQIYITHDLWCSVALLTRCCHTATAPFPGISP